MRAYRTAHSFQDPGPLKRYGDRGDENIFRGEIKAKHWGRLESALKVETRGVDIDVKKRFLRFLFFPRFFTFFNVFYFCQSFLL
jgi:hypothetical protein